MSDAARAVHLHVGRSVHPMIRDQLHGVPAGYAYRQTHPDLIDASVPTKLVSGRASAVGRLTERLEPLAILALSEAGYIRRDRVSVDDDVALVHSVQFLLRSPERPYVVDFEHLEAFGLYQRPPFERPWGHAVLRRAVLDERCRFLLPWSDAARAATLNALGPETARRVEEKTVTVRPCLPVAVRRPRERREGPLRLLFVGTKFLVKGGPEAILALERVRRTHDVELDLISYTPPLWRARAERAGIRVHTPLGADALRALYADVDALLFPTHMDTLGYVALEAMAQALPVIGSDHFAVPETVGEDGGLLFPKERSMYREDGMSTTRHTLPPPRRLLRALERPSDRYVDEIAARIAWLAEDADLYGRLSAGALERVRTGPFSIARRRESLRRIYDAALA